MPQPQRTMEEEIDDFIKKHCGENAPHLLDSDENDGQRLRELVRQEISRAEDMGYGQGYRRCEQEISSEKQAERERVVGEILEEVQKRAFERREMYRSYNLREDEGEISALMGIKKYLSSLLTDKVLPTNN